MGTALIQKKKAFRATLARDETTYTNGFISSDYEKHHKNSSKNNVPKTHIIEFSLKMSLLEILHMLWPWNRIKKFSILDSEQEGTLFVGKSDEAVQESDHEDEKRKNKENILSEELIPWHRIWKASGLYCGEEVAELIHVEIAEEASEEVNYRNRYFTIVGKEFSEEQISKFQMWETNAFYNEHQGAKSIHIESGEEAVEYTKIEDEGLTEKERRFIQEFYSWNRIEKVLKRCSGQQEAESTHVKMTVKAVEREINLTQ